MRLLRVVSFILFCLVHLSAQAAWRIDTSSLRLSPPPSPGSAAEQNDFQVLLVYQEKRTEAECRAADSQSIPSMAALFGPRTGALSAGELALVKEFGHEVIETIEKASQPFKKHWSRPRPYDVNSEIKPCIRAPGGQTSYPSSHAAAGIVLGELLAQIFPDKTDVIHRTGLRVGENRVLGGVHHPSDVLAGRTLAKQILKALAQNPDFRQALDALRRQR